MNESDLVEKPFASVFSLIENWEEQKKIFQSSFENEFYGHRIISVSEDKEMYKIMNDCYESDHDQFQEFTFERYILIKLKSTFISCLKLIRNGFNFCVGSTPRKIEYSDLITTQFNRLKTNEKLLCYFSIMNFLGVVESEINNILFTVDDNIKVPRTNFQPKDFLKRHHLESMYNIAQSYDLLEDEITLLDFQNTLSYDDLEYKMRFRCSASKSIAFIEVISKAFNNLNKQTVDSSKKFISKSGKPITATNYRTVLSRKNQDIHKIKQDYLDLLSFLELLD